MRLRLPPSVLLWTEVCGTWEWKVPDTLTAWLERHPGCSFEHDDPHVSDDGLFVGRTFWIATPGEEDFVLAKLTFGEADLPRGFAPDGC